MSNKGEHTIDNDDLCIVCYRNVDLYSIGPCDHPVCYECSTRMRVLCKQKECPICRSGMPEVIFTRTVKPFADLRPNPHTYDQKYGLRFCSYSIQQAYYNLLAFTCQTCGRSYKNFLMLKEHMRKDHELYYCELCVDNVKIFAFERKCYNRAELAMHRRKGDNDDKSHRGHPLCQFCDQRYLDNDDLFRHLRRDHLYCHFCDADGKHQYYSSYDELRVHFLEDHYLCEEGDCRNQPFTSVFRSEIDYKAHIALIHSRHLSRGAIKHARTLEVEFNIKPRAYQNNFRSYNQNIAPEMPLPDEEGAVGYDEPGGSRQPLHQLNESDFPTLGNTDSNNGLTRTSVMFTSKMSKPKFNDEEFPSLGGVKGNHSAPSRPSSAQPLKANRNDDFPALSRPGNVVITKSQPASASRSKVTNLIGSNSYGKAVVSVPKPAPVVPRSSGMVKLTVNPDRVRSSNLSIHVNHNAGSAGSSSASIKVVPKPTSEAFPALGSSAVIPETAQWAVTKVKKVNEPKPSKVAKAPVLPTSSLADFPTLGSKKNGKKATCVVMPVMNRLESTINNNDNSRSNNNSYTATNANNSNVKNRKPDSNADKCRQNGQKNVQPQSKQSAEVRANKNKGKKNRAPENAPLPSTADRVGGVHKVTNREPERVATFVVRPPPGFEGTLTSNNDLTFTNSSGQSYSILPTSKSKSSPYSYIQPRNFHIRNTNLIRNFTAILGHPNALQEFKSFSDEFRGGTYKAEDYYGYCKIVLLDAFEEIFPELLVLLPDIQKQQELYILHGNQTFDLEQCTLCKQIVFSNELKPHMDTHYIQNHFPSMGIEEAGVASKAQH